MFAVPLGTFSTVWSATVVVAAPRMKELIVAPSVAPFFSVTEPVITWLAVNEPSSTAPFCTTVFTRLPPSEPERSTRTMPLWMLKLSVSVAGLLKALTLCAMMLPLIAVAGVLLIVKVVPLVTATT